MMKVGFEAKNQTKMFTILTCQIKDTPPSKGAADGGRDRVGGGVGQVDAGVGQTHDESLLSRGNPTGHQRHDRRYTQRLR